MNTNADLAAALDGIGPRLQRIRTGRGLTLAEVAELAGTSASTISRLESGVRRPGLELLFPLARAYGMSLDDLIGAPEFGDPRVQLRPRRRNGRIVIPLSRNPGGVKAWKVVMPVEDGPGALRTHDGSEWIYVLSGRIRLIVGKRDLVLGPGEVADFDTRTPHWFGATGAAPAEILSLFDRNGARVHILEAGDDGDEATASS
ncbi:MAG: XRE family transcriptional regulator [Microbacterium sp. 14-71-5]|uniref:helix-turn-helix domain-containing protein n=1 Tax=Microbacterium sp. 13-71-7 TaxID=1970399 RepID=UPI000BC7B3B7|nr:XRE family transcriptional regulator [Microbacterium sp. 13-71-7]OZB82689.1 MAG: XRE family transcriptional regulator [Microbacterium sp. 13-71-7]OZB88756.1 MAG: XRE family transcriptional regulator [Microbacterium sp. 14-71-5]